MDRSTSRPSIPLASLFDLTVNRLRALCAAAGLGAAEGRIVDLYARLVHPWGRAPLADAPGWNSQIGDDGSPIEFSLALSATPELRIMVEPLGRVPSLHANAAAALALLDELGREFPIDLERLSRLRDLFLPDDMQGAFAVWVAAMFAPGREPQFKLYLNPQIGGRTRAPELLEEAMLRLGLHDAPQVIRTTLARRGPTLDELKYFSLDLSPSTVARIKVYARHHQSNVEDLEAAASGCLDYRRGDVTDFLDAVAPGLTTFGGRPPFTCHAYVQGRGSAASSATTHFPINGYARDALEVRERVRACLRRLGLPDDVYRRSFAACESGAAGHGPLHAYTSFRRERGAPRLTVYLPVEAYSIRS